MSKGHNGRGRRGEWCGRWKKRRAASVTPKQPGVAKRGSGAAWQVMAEVPESLERTS
jgi:hypothetical protein